MHVTVPVRPTAVYPTHVLVTVLVLTALLCASTAAPAATLVVNKTTGPYYTIQSAIDAAASSGDTIQVAAGTYVENLVWDTKDLQLLGAGAGVSIVDGNAAGSCLRMTNVPATSRVEAFTFMNGRADSGGGLYLAASSPTISNTTISGNTASHSGGGLYLAASSPTISNTTISGNTATSYGGGLSVVSSSSPTITNTTISGNTAASTSSRGGGLYLNFSSPTITNTTINDNSAASGGGLYLSQTGATISNATISRNTASANRGGGIYVFSGSTSPAVITNTIVAFSTNGGGICTDDSTPSTPTVTYSNVYGNVGGQYGTMVDPTGTDGNISEDPLFADAVSGDFHLLSKGGRWDGTGWVIDAVHSPCIAAGDPTSDYSNEPVPNGDRINMGRWGNTCEASKWVDVPPSPPRPNVVWVDDDYAPGLYNDGHTWGHDAFSTIQAGIDRVASPGTVHVAAGTYVENLHWNTKDLQLLGAGAGTTVVDGNAAGSCLRMDNVPATSRVEGFSFSNGNASGPGSASYGGGIYCHNSAPTISNNTISGNTAYYYGGGIYCLYSSPTINNNTISGNTGTYGGGLYLTNSSPTISNNTINTNTASIGGGGLSLLLSSPAISDTTISGNEALNGGALNLSSSSPTITNAIISGNTASSSSGGGGGLYMSSSAPTISNTVINGNTTTGYGGGLYLSASSPTIGSNTIVGNTAPADRGGGIYVKETSSRPVITNTIVAFSTNGRGIYRASGTPTVTYCNLYGNTGGDTSGVTLGTGCISRDPMFADAGGGDFHLKSTVGRWDGSSWVTDTVHSPCIDAGDPGSAYANEPAPNGGRINMGAWGNTAEASKGWSQPAPSVVWVDDDYAPGLYNDGHTWGHDAFRTIQNGIDRVASPGTVHVAAGTYVENLVWDTKDLQLLGAGAGSSIVDGNAAGSCLRMTSVPATSRVEGFTFRNGRASGTAPLNCGGGLYLSSSSPTITNSTISGNTAAAAGGGLYLSSSSPTITSNTIGGNTSSSYGGGLYLSSSSPTISHNTVSGNTGTHGGGLYLTSSSPMISNNTISGNTASTGTDGAGGGLYLSVSSPTITNTTISGNTAISSGGGLYLAYSSSTITNTTISGNKARANSGGGIYIWHSTSSPVITNTIVAFSTGGSGIYCASGTPAIAYCDVYGNVGGEYGNMTDPTGTDGNISVDPLFADAAGGDFHLKSTVGRWDGAGWVVDAVHSPGIDAGDPGSSYANEPAPNGGRINMGRWGNTPEASKGYNRPPSVVSVEITPDPAVTTNDLTATPSGWSDPDGDPAGYDFQWAKWDGAAWQDIAGATTDTLAAAQTAKGDRIQVTCWPNDGTEQGAPVTDEVTIGNTAPTVTSVGITPDPAYTTDDLTATPAGWFDADGDPEGYDFQWAKWDGAAWQNIAGATTDTLPAAQTAKGDLIRVTCTPNDGTETGAPVTDEITIGNRPPTQPTVDVTPDAPGGGDDLHVAATGSTDPDGDTVTYGYKWYTDTVHQPGYDNLDTVPAAATTRGEVWRCEATPNDGTQDGPMNFDEVNIGNGAPSVAAVDITPDPAGYLNDLTATPSGWSDPDGDPAGYLWQWEVDTGAGFVVVPGATTNKLTHAHFDAHDRVRVTCTPTDGAEQGAPVTDTITILDMQPTALRVNDATGTQGKNVQLVARLTCGGAPVVGKSVSFDIDGGAPVVGVTDGNGIAAVSYAITEAPGAHVINAAFAGDGAYMACSGSATLTVNLPAPIWIKVYLDGDENGATLTAGETVACTAIDSNGTDVTASTVFYADAAAKGSWLGKTYTSQVEGSWTVTGVYGGLVDTAPLTVNHGAAASVVIAPASSTITTAQTQTYTVQVTDAQGNSWSEVLLAAAWDKRYGDDKYASGTFGDDNTYTPGALDATDGPVYIRATVGGVQSNRAELTVLPLDGIGNILAWDKDTLLFYLCANPSNPQTGFALSPGANPNAGGTGIDVTVTGRAGDMTATVTTPGGISNSLRVRWYLSGGAVYRAYEYSTIAGVAKDATFSAGRTYVTGMGYLTGFWGLDHTVDTGVPSITFGATQQP